MTETQIDDIMNRTPQTGFCANDYMFSMMASMQKQQAVFVETAMRQHKQNVAVAMHATKAMMAMCTPTWFVTK